MDITAAQKALHGIAHWALARLFAGTPPAEQIDRAQRVLCGQLARQAPHVVESFATDYESAVIAVSPAGTIAVLGVRRHADGYSGELIVRTPDGSRSKPTHQWRTPFKPLIKLFFVDGSEDPVCVVDQRLTWRGAEAMLPRDLFVVDGPQFTGTVPSACLCMWVEFTGDRLHVGYVHRGLVCHRELSGEVPVDRETSLFREGADIHWLGVIGNRLLCVLRRGDEQIVRREDGREFALPVGAKICTDTIVGSLDGTVKFVCWQGSRRLACFWGDGRPEVHEVHAREIVCVGRGALLFFSPCTGDVRSLQAQSLLWIGEVGEVSLPPGTHGPWKVQDAMRDNGIVIDGIATTPRDQDIHYVLTIPHARERSGTLQHVGSEAEVLVLHGAMAVATKESFQWAAGPWYPMHGSGPRGLGSAFGPGKKLLAVGAAFTDGTVHVLSYDLNR